MVQERCGDGAMACMVCKHVHVALCCRPGLCEDSPRAMDAQDGLEPGSQTAPPTPAPSSRGPAPPADKPVSAAAMRKRQSRARQAEKVSPEEAAQQRKREMGWKVELCKVELT